MLLSTRANEKIIKILISHCGGLGDQYTLTPIKTREDHSAKHLRRLDCCLASKSSFHSQENINYPCPDLKAINYAHSDCFPSF